MRNVIIAAALVALFACVGCGGMSPGPDANFWTQCVRFDGYGVSMLTQYGPVNLGRLTWTRNADCEKKPEVTKP